MFSTKKALLTVIVSSLCLLLLSTPACTSNPVAQDRAGNPVARGETLTQISTIDAILGGVYDGVVDFGTLKRYGDFGLGTLEGLDGEMLGFEGNFYQVRADGIAYPIPDSMKTPFASVTFFEVDCEQQLPQGTDYEQLEDLLDEALPTDNIFYAIRIDGTFSHIRTRSVPAQEKPYPPLVEVARNQPTFEFTDVEGTIVGFRCPSYVASINVPGYHLHFLTKNKDSGGHVLDFKIAEAVAYIDCTSEFLMILPGEDSDFYDLDLTQDRLEELEEAEK